MNRVYITLSFISMGVAAYTDPLSTMNTYPDYGFVEICMSSDCNVQNPSLVLSLDHLGNDVSVDPSTKQVTFGTELSVFDYTYQFAKNIDEVFEPFLTTPAVDDSASPTAIKSTMTLKMCATGCTPRTAESGEMQATASGILKDSIVLELEVLHRVADVNVNPRGFEQYTFPRNGLQVNLNMAISPPASDPSFSLSGFALTFLLAVTDSKAPLTQTSMSQPQGTMYLHRLEFGSDMFMDLPTYGTMDGSAHPITVSAIPLTSVDTANMIQVTLEFGSATSVTAIKYVSCVTPGPSAFAHTLAPTVVTPLKAASGVSVPQNLVFLPRVSFALCLDPICSTSALAIGFRGVGNTDWINLKRFRDSTAFQFADPLQQSLSQYGQAEVYWSSFSAWVPKYKQSLPVKVDPALASAHLNDPRLDVEVAYFLTNGSVSAGSASIAIPVNSVKLTIMISNWYFVSSTDSLKFNLTLSSLTDSLKSVVDFSTSFSSIVKTATIPIGGGLQGVEVTLDEGKVLVLPLFAELDGGYQSIDADVVPDIDGDIVVVLKSPHFSSSLNYSPVLHATPATNAPIPSPTYTPVKLKKQVKSWVRRRHPVGPSSLHRLRGDAALRQEIPTGEARFLQGHSINCEKSIC